MVQGGLADRLAEAAPTSRFGNFAEALGGREDIRVVEPQPADEQGLREAVCHQRGVRLRSDG